MIGGRQNRALPSRDLEEREASEKWEVQLRKGCLELAILASLWGGRLYGLEILRRLESGSDMIVSEGTVYPLLSRLKSLALVESEWVESGGGHPAKVLPANRCRQGPRNRNGSRLVGIFLEPKQVA